MFNGNEHEFEAYLKRFRFREPPPLCLPPRPRPKRWHWTLRWTPAFAAMLVIAVALLQDGKVIPPRHKGAAVPAVVDRAGNFPPLTLGRLSAIGERGPHAADALLTRAASQSLPDVERPGGVLQSLAGN